MKFVAENAVALLALLVVALAVASALLHRSHNAKAQVLANDIDVLRKALGSATASLVAQKMQDGEKPSQIAKDVTGKLASLAWLALPVLFLSGCPLRPMPNPTPRSYLVADASAVPVPPPVTVAPSGANLGAIILSAADCSKLDNEQIGWTAASVVFGVLSGSGGIVASVFDNSAPRYVVGSVGLTLAAGAALSAYLANTYQHKYVAGCTLNVGGK
jgi:hypothetical protein